jgi:mono/diheme cytochrome c family protein
MLRCRLILVGFVCAQFIGSAAGQKSELKKEPIHYTSPASGQEMFMSYCAVCHGKDAKGAGPAASVLKIAPANLTTLTKRHGGKFPSERVSTMIMGEADLPAHGTREMPVWGPLFRSLDSHGDMIVRQRIVSLEDYLKSVQEK